MGPGFYLMVVMSILMYRVAEADKRRGWIWSGVNLCVTMGLGKFYGLGVMMVIGGFILTFVIMFVVNLLGPKNPGN